MEAVANHHEPFTGTPRHWIPYSTPPQWQHLAGHITESYNSWMETSYCFSDVVPTAFNSKTQLLFCGYQFLNVHREVLEGIALAWIADHEPVPALGCHLCDVAITQIHQWRSEGLVKNGLSWDKETYDRAERKLCGQITSIDVRSCL